jgi:gamma-glutamyl:cysteine ligase YbdK (ATP-grasp superfamily)
MGEEILKSSFNKDDFKRFDKELDKETLLLKSWFDKNSFSKREKVGGVEIEACLVDDNGVPKPHSSLYLSAIDDPMIVHELSSFNIEFNCAPEEIKGKALSNFEHSLTKTWKRAQKAANKLDLNLVTIGILPTLEDKMMTLDNMSPLERYKAMNEQVLHLRNDKPIKLSITGNEHLESIHNDVMLEAVATAFQIHLQTPQNSAASFYNASKIISAPLVALGANSPYLFGKDLWAETRIPLFEQSVSIGKSIDEERVTFGLKYVEDSLFDTFDANQKRYPVIMPAEFNEAPEEMHHVKLHNGTIWRWNRPILGTDDDNTPHLRIEQRVLPSGPTMVDMVANMAFYYGLVFWLVENEPELERKIPFDTAHDNFYEAAKKGLDAKINWIDKEGVSIQELILEDLLPKAEKGLTSLGIDVDDIEKYLSIIKERVISKQNGAQWQREYVLENGHNMNELTKSYLKNQETGKPVHTWSLKP